MLQRGPETSGGVTIGQLKQRSMFQLQGGLLIKELRLLKSHFTKASAPSLLSIDGGSSATSDENIHKQWVEHFEGVFNSGTSVSEAV